MLLCGTQICTIWKIMLLCGTQICTIWKIMLLCGTQICTIWKIMLLCGTQICTIWKIMLLCGNACEPPLNCVIKSSTLSLRVSHSSQRRWICRTDCRIAITSQSDLSTAHKSAAALFQSGVLSVHRFSRKVFRSNSAGSVSQRRPIAAAVPPSNWRENVSPDYLG